MKKGILIVSVIVILYLILKNGHVVRVDMDEQESKHWKILYQRDQNNTTKRRIRLEDIDDYWKE